MYSGRLELHITENSQKNQAKYFADRIISIIAKMDKKEIRALDFGAGNGHISEILVRKLEGRHLSVEVSCLEIDPILQEEIKSRNLKVITKLEKEKYDIIFSSHVLEHVEDDRRLLSELYMSLKNGGKLFLIVPLHTSLWTDMDQRIGHFRRYSIPILNKAMKECGFELDSAKNFDSIGFLFAKILIFLKRADSVLSTSHGLMMIRIYDVLILPVSITLDKLGFGKLPGRNGMFLASKRNSQDTNPYVEVKNE